MVLQASFDTQLYLKQKVLPLVSPGRLEIISAFASAVSSVTN